MAKILVVEADIDLAGRIKSALDANTYRVDMVHDGEVAAYHLRSYGYELIILDLAITKLSGAEVVKAFRAKNTDTPIIMLTDGETPPDQSSGYLPNVDDHLRKPFTIEELMSRVRAVLNRAFSMNGQILSAGDIELEPAQGRVYKSAIEIKLSQEEFAVLEFLLRNRGKVSTVQDLFKSCWSSKTGLTTDAVHACVEKLRTSVDSRGGHSIIKSVRGTGYTID